MLHLSASCNYYLHRTPTDMRKGFDSLCGIVTSELKMNVLSGAVFIFMNKKHNQVKLLLWEGDGFAIYYKRLEKGTYELPLNNNNAKDFSITNEALQYILQGVSLKSVRKRKRYQHCPQNCG
ncbi:MAG TPA: IS66 family insertion sequence element accessory protein TnpB [Hanamia sp.]|jgi:transposase|nr:IS66 family insertion sequence element accessory protein TnpB [Hanamia sp.]